MADSAASILATRFGQMLPDLLWLLLLLCAGAALVLRHVVRDEATLRPIRLNS